MAVEGTRIGPSGVSFQWRDHTVREQGPGASAWIEPPERCSPSGDTAQAADLPSRRRIDDHLTGSGEALQAGCQIGCLTDRRLLARIPRADRLADDHKPGGDANADLERLAQIR